MTASGVTKNYVYDANGNLTNDGVHTYEYDAENRMKSVDSGATGAYAYDYRNRRIKKVVPGSSTHYVWEGYQVIAEHDASTGAVIYNYVYSGSRLIARMGNGIINWYLNDRLSERVVLDANGSVIGRMAHVPFGEDFAETGTQEKHHFTTYERDGESSTEYAVNRQYTVLVGRFNRSDPFAGSANNRVPQSLNRHAYAINDAVNRVDPLGLIGYCGPPCHAVIDENTGGTRCECPPTPNPDFPEWGHDIGVWMDGWSADPIPSDAQAEIDLLPYLMAIINSAVDAAMDKLNNDECKKLLTGADGTDPATKLDSLRKSNNIVTGSGQYTDSQGKQQSYEGLWSNGQILIGPAFFQHLAYRMEGSIKLHPAELRTHLILHELGHATGAPMSEHQDANGKINWKKLSEYDRAIAQKCFGGK